MLIIFLLNSYLLKNLKSFVLIEVLSRISAKENIKGIRVIVAWEKDCVKHSDIYLRQIGNFAGVLEVVKKQHC